MAPFIKRIFFFVDIFIFIMEIYKTEIYKFIKRKTM